MVWIINIFYSMTHFDDLLSDLNEMPLFPEVMPLGPPNLCPASDEITLSNSRLEHLFLYVHTQSLRITPNRINRVHDCLSDILI